MTLDAPAAPTAAPPAPPAARRSVDGWLVGCLLGLATFSVVFVWRAMSSRHGVRYVSLFDDAMISMRYARNLATGHGLAWNHHGAPVEGYTNPLWTLWMAVLHLAHLGDTKTGLLVIATSLGLLLGNVVVVHAIARRLAPDSTIVVATATVLTATYYPLAYWSLRGMEVGLLTFLVSGSVLLLLRLRDEYHPRDLAWLGVAMGAMVAVRTDSLVPCAILAVYAIASSDHEHRRVVAATTLGAVVGVTLALSVFRVLYYGDLLPNTYYLKMTGVATGTRVSTGLRALRQLAVVHLATMVAVAVPALAALRRTRDSALVLLAALFAGQCVYSAYVGGDAWELFGYSNRYICVVVPMLALLAAVGIGEICRGPVERSARLAGTVLVALGLAALALRTFGDAKRVFPAPNVASIADLDRYHGVLVVGGLLALVVGGLLCSPSAPARAAGRLILARPALVATGLGLLVVVATNGMAITDWYHHNGHSVDLDNSLVAAGQVERAGTAPRAVIAVWFAGNSAYFSHRDSLDLLGKNDAHIAHLRSTGPFIPGHSKHDLDYSIRRLRPDVVDLGPTPFGFTPDQLRRYRGWGYEAVGPSVLVRTDSKLVDRARLATLYEGQRLAR